MPTKKKKNIEAQQNQLYEEISKHCDGLRIARYLKNEAKSALRYFHSHKLSNIKKNLKEFSDYLLFLNEENCQRINSFTAGKESKKELNNSVTYFYDYKNTTNKELELIQTKIETNAYETITLMQSIKGCLILTIDEFCNASPTRIDIMRYNLCRKTKQQAKAKSK